MGLGRGMGGVQGVKTLVLGLETCGGYAAGCTATNSFGGK